MQNASHTRSIELKLKIENIFLKSCSGTRFSGQMKPKIKFHMYSVNNCRFSFWVFMKNVNF